MLEITFIAELCDAITQLVQRFDRDDSTISVAKLESAIGILTSIRPTFRKEVGDMLEVIGLPKATVRSRVRLSDPAGATPQSRRPFTSPPQ